MHSFEPLYERAIQRHGQALALRLPEVRSAEEIRSTPDDRYLAQMTQGVFQAGFVWRVIQNKWPGFEQAFLGFEPQALLNMEAEELAALRQDTRIVRNGQKIDATLKNALWVDAISEEYGGFGAFLAQWPQDDIIGLWAALKKQGARLGGDTGPRFLRRSGVDTFVLTGDVKQALTHAGVAITKGTSQRDQRAAQAAFLEWREETGMPMAHLSVILACSVGEL
ncbi:MAG: 3-methyladenine DNA glycosylase Tag [Cognaticolwellia sp.]|jgi:3-methyladenine DNA glycosylase Tag